MHNWTLYNVANCDKSYLNLFSTSNSQPGRLLFCVPCLTKMSYLYIFTLTPTNEQTNHIPIFLLLSKRPLLLSFANVNSKGIKTNEEKRAKGTGILVWLKEIKNKNVRNTTVNTNTNVPHPTTLKKDSILSHSEFAVCKISISMQSVYWCKTGPNFVFTPQWIV